MNRSIEARLERLEADRQPPAPPLFVWCSAGEEPEAATARHQAEHPEQAGRNVIVVGWLAPQ